MTPDQVRAFQAGPPEGPPPADYLGKPLVVDGLLGPRTRWALEMATLALWRQNVVRFLCSLHGMRESGINRGAVIDRAMALCQLDNDVDGPGPSEAGYPWCAALASLALYRHSPHPFTPDARVRRLVASLHPVPPERVLPGDLAYVLRPDGTGHVGTVIARSGLVWTASVDGNLSNQVLLVRYPLAERGYVSVEPQATVPAVPLELPIYRPSLGTR